MFVVPLSVVCRKFWPLVLALASALMLLLLLWLVLVLWFVLPELFLFECCWLLSPRYLLRLREAKLGRIMPLSEAAKYCGITPQAVHYHVKMGNITPVPNSNPMCVYQSDLEWLKVKNKKPKQIRYEKD